MPAYDDARFSPAAPVADVSIRNSDTRKSESNVVMLIDTGADVTLLPAAVVSVLELERGRSRYELIAFDGTTSQAEAVHAEVLFLHRIFKGRFLLTDQVRWLQILRTEWSPGAPQV